MGERVFVKGDTTKEGLDITWIDSETQKRDVESIIFHDYFYITLEDFEDIKNSLKMRWSKHLLNVTLVKGRNDKDIIESFAKIILRDNRQKYYLRQWIEEEHDIPTFEADLNTSKRYLVDNHKKTKLNILKSPYIFYDLETDDRNDFKYDEYNNVIPENVILSFSGTDYKGNTFFFINEDAENPQCEIDLLNKIRDLFLNYSITSGWNSDSFDDIYLAGRCKIHGLPDFTKLVNKIDFMYSYKKYRIEISLDSYKLDNIAKVELDESKVDVRKGGGRLYQLYLSNKEKIKEYNIQDTELLYRLNKKLKFIEIHLMTAEQGNCRPELTKYNIGSNDYFIMMKCKDRGVIAPSNPTKEEQHRRRAIGGIGGGYTRGVPGLYNYVGVFDFSSLYPSLEITYNISPEKFVMNCTIKDEVQYLEHKDENIQVFENYEEMLSFIKEKNYIIVPSDLTYVAKTGREIYHPYRLFKGDNIGLLPSIMIELLEERFKVKGELKALKKSMELMDKNSQQYIDALIECDRLYNLQLAIKYMLNSSYGLNALPAYRFFKWDVADSITAAGRNATKNIRRFAEENNFNVIFSDTDSIGISPLNDNNISLEEANTEFKNFDGKLVEFVDEMLSKTNNNVYTRTDNNGKKHNHRLILEFEKTYSPLLYKKKKRYAGLIKSEIFGDKVDIKGLESTQMNVMAAKLQNEFINDVLYGRFNTEDWKTKMADVYQKCFSGEIEEENLYISMKFTDRAVNQKRPRAHTLLAERMIEQGLDVSVGDKIKYIVESVKPKQYAVSPEEFKINKTYPADYYWDIFTKPLISLMGIIKNIDVFNIVIIPELEKIKTKLAKETDDEKKMKLIERIRKKEEKLLNTSIDENEDEDTLL